MSYITSMATHYFLEIRKGTGGRYCGRIHRGDAATVQELPELDLDPGAKLAIKGRTYTLGELTAALIAFKADFRESVFDERGQLELGRYLFDQTLGRWEGARSLPEAEAEVRLSILAEDEDILRLPWVLLARGGNFLSALGWAVALDRTGPLDDCHLPPSPHLLVVMPQPPGVPDTQAQAHLQELEEMLSLADHHFVRGRHLQLARTWEEFQDQAAARHHDILYYYGHGVGDMHRSRLVFTKASTRFDAPVADLAACLRKAPGGPPLLTYVNCCQGDAGGVLGAGRQLLDLVPAVVTNRTVAYIDAARRQALQFWDAVLLKGTAPHAAVANLYSRLGGLDLSLKDARWMTPVLHCHYRNWRSSPPRIHTELDRDPHWRFKLDRISQFSRVFYQTQTMLRERKPRSLAYVWYGEPGQGVDLFHERLAVELRESLPGSHLYKVPLRWPDEFRNIDRSFKDMMTEGFEVVSLDAIADRIRGQTRGETGRSILVYARHEPVQAGDPFKPDRLSTYLEWWDHNIAPTLACGDAFGLLGVSFVVSNPPKFQEALAKRLDNLELRDTVVHVLDEMERIAKKDLREFLDTHNVSLPRDRRERILDEVLKKTGGHYDQTLEELKALVEERAWDLEEEDRASGAANEEEDWGL